jgi:hypothetical protein
MSRARRIPARGDVTAAIVAELLGLSLSDFETWRPILHERKFPQPDPATGLYCIEAVQKCKAEVFAMRGAAEYERNNRKREASETRFQAATLSAINEPSVEEPCATRRGRVEEHGDVLLHFCVECGRFGPYGYGVRLRAGQLGRWYCREHRPQDPGLART